MTTHLKNSSQPCNGVWCCLQGRQKPFRGVEDWPLKAKKLPTNKVATLFLLCHESLGSSSHAQATQWQTIVLFIKWPILNDMSLSLLMNVNSKFSSRLFLIFCITSLSTITSNYCMHSVMKIEIMPRLESACHLVKYWVLDGYPSF